MKNLISIIIFLLYIIPIFAQTGTIFVNILGVENNKGIVRIGLYNEKANFPIYEKHFKGVSINANTTGVRYTFTNIPMGTYAIAVWQDKDDNKVINKNFFGAPNENYGFSKNIYGSFGPPDFDEVSFKVNSKREITFTINLE